MRCGKVVIGLGLGLMLAGCYDYGYGYGYRGRYGGRYGTGVVYTPPPQPVQQQVVVQGQVGMPVQPQIVVSGEGIAGSDGTRGWRVGSQAPDQDFQRILQSVGRASCQVEMSTQVELRAACTGNVHIMLRFDQQNVYKLCTPGTDPNACSQVWSVIGN